MTLKVAICISGQIRSLEKNLSINKLASALDASLFVSVWDEVGKTSAYDRFFPTYIARKLIDFDEDNKKYIYKLEKFKGRYPSLYNLFSSTESLTFFDLKKIYPNITNYNIEKFPESFNENLILGNIEFPKALLKFMPERYKFSLPMYYMISKANRLKIDYELEHNIKFDIVIRLRPDADLHNIEELVNHIKNIRLNNENSIIYFPEFNESRLGKEKFFLHDTFAFGTSEQMDIYSSIYENLHDYWNLNLFPEWSFKDRAAEGLMLFHILNKKISPKSSPVKIKVDKVNILPLEMVYKCLLNDLNGKKLSINEKKVFSLLLGEILIHSKDDVISLNNYISDFKINYIQDNDSENEKVLFWPLYSFYKKSNQMEKAGYFLEQAFFYLGSDRALVVTELAKYYRNYTNELAKALGVLVYGTINFEKEFFILRDIAIIYLEISKKLISQRKKDRAKFMYKMAYSYFEEAFALNSKNNILLSMKNDLDSIANKMSN